MNKSYEKNPALRAYCTFLAGHPDELEAVRVKCNFLWNLRNVLHDQGFLETPTPILHAYREGAPVHQFVTHHPLTGQRYYLRHSMEDHLRRLVIALPRVYELGKAVRAELEDDSHAEEFLLLEAAVRDVEFDEGCRDVVDVLREVLHRTFGSSCPASLDLSALRVESFSALAAQLLDPSLTRSEAELVHAARAWLASRSHQVPPSATAWEVLEAFMRYGIEPSCMAPTLIKGFPPALRHISPVDPVSGMATRFSLVAGGIEFCDGGLKFSSPNDYRAVHETNAALRNVLLDITDNDLSEDFFADISVESCPVFTYGIGIDRIFSLARHKAIHDVIQFPYH